MKYPLNSNIFLGFKDDVAPKKTIKLALMGENVSKLYNLVFPYSEPDICLVTGNSGNWSIL